MRTTAKYVNHSLRKRSGKRNTKRKPVRRRNQRHKNTLGKECGPTGPQRGINGPGLRRGRGGGGMHWKGEVPFDRSQLQPSRSLPSGPPPKAYATPWTVLPTPSNYFPN